MAIPSHWKTRGCVSGNGAAQTTTGCRSKRAPLVMLIGDLKDADNGSNIDIVQDDTMGNRRDVFSGKQRSSSGDSGNCGIYSKSHPPAGSWYCVCSLESHFGHESLTPYVRCPPAPRRASCATAGPEPVHACRAQYFSIRQVHVNRCQISTLTRGENAPKTHNRTVLVQGGRGTNSTRSSSPRHLIKRKRDVQ